MPKLNRKRKKQNPVPEHKPTTVMLIRHGENDWTETHKLAGRTSGVHLNNFGRLQAAALGNRLAEVDFGAIYASPLERTVETARAIAQHHKLELETCPGLLEVDYGDWTGEKIAKLAKTPSWPVIQFYPSGAGFPQGETMYGMQARFVQEINRLATKHPGQTIVVVGHADLIKSAVAHYLGVHLDLFQRIVISTASITTIMLGRLGPRVIQVNDTNHNPPRPKQAKKKKKKKQKK